MSAADPIALFHAVAHLVLTSDDPWVRETLLRARMDAKKSRLLCLSGGAATFLTASCTLMACIPVAGWWAGLACVPLSLLGARDGRAWRDLRYRWEPPLVVPALPQPSQP